MKKNYLLAAITFIFLTVCNVEFSQGQENDNDASQEYSIFQDILPFQIENEEQETMFLIDNFEIPSKYNLLKKITNVYQMAPSRIMMSVVTDTRKGEKNNVLKLKYRRSAEEAGPYDKGGWCGYYTMLKAVKPTENIYFNAGDYEYLTFWLRGQNGGENFVVGLADRHWDKAGDTVKSDEIIRYLPGKRVTTEWQQVKIPLENFLLDTTKLSSISISFERYCFTAGYGEGIIYIDDIAFE